MILEIMKTSFLTLTGHVNGIDKTIKLNEIIQYMEKFL
jgi:hypothetical protein